MFTTTNEQQRLLNIIFASWPGLTELDKRLIQIAISNPPKFMSLLGDDSVIAAKTCLLRQDKKSYGQIAQSLKITYKKARYACNGCDDKNVN
jgi:hypothetical protein